MTESTLKGELIMFLVFGLPVGGLVWFFAEELGEIFRHNATKRRPRIEIGSDRPSTSSRGLSPDWQAGVAVERTKTDVTVIRGTVAVLLLFWAVKIAWRAIAAVA